MFTDKKYKLFCLSLGEVLNETIVEAIKRIKNKHKKNDFDSGYLCGIHRIVTLMQQQAEIFEISFRDLGIDFEEADIIL